MSLYYNILIKQAKLCIKMLEVLENEDIQVEKNIELLDAVFGSKEKREDHQ